jgi:hypothetical protein
MRYMQGIALFLIMLSSAASADTVLVPGTGVSFEPPEGFTRLSASEMAIKYPPERANTFTVGNQTRGTSIACDLTAQDLPPDQLREAMDGMTPTIERSVPGIQWKQRSVITMHGHQWIYMELTSRAANADIHNIMLMTSLHGKFFVCNFNSTTDEFPQLEAKLRKSMQSIVLPADGPQR